MPIRVAVCAAICAANAHRSTLVNSFSWRHKQVLICAPGSLWPTTCGDRSGRSLDDADDGRDHPPVRLLRVAPGMCVVMHEIRVSRLGVRRCPAESHRRRVGSRVFHRRVGAYSSVGSFSRGGRQISPTKIPLWMSPHVVRDVTPGRILAGILRADCVPVTSVLFACYSRSDFSDRDRAKDRSGVREQCDSV
jgi:hypothetical protein